MKIAILLPYKENYSKLNAGAVSIFVNDTVKLSKFKSGIKVYGSTESKKVLNNYKNIKFEKKFYQSSSNKYLKSFLDTIKNENIDILEVHNRPHYINFLKKFSNYKKVLFFHNDPLNMHGSVSVKERLDLLNITDRIVFNSNWSKSRFLIDLPYSRNYDKLEVIHQSTSKTKINFNKKKKIISFIGKLNSSKGYDIFGKAVLKILNKYDDWSAIVIGDEPRQKFFFEHVNLNHLGFKENSFILNKLKEVSIATVPSRWDEPFGRSSLEAASRGCALIISNTGGLSETTNKAIILNKISEDELFNKIEYLIRNKKYRNYLQRKTYNDFSLTNQNATSKIDSLRKELIINKKINLVKNIKKPLKIIHITNFNERFDGRLHYNTGKRINNGLIRLGHNILTISDRDILSNYKNLKDPKGVNTLNNKIINSFNYFNPDMIITGHADNISLNTFEYIKNKKKTVKIAQWFLDPVSKFGPDFDKNKNRLLKNVKFIDANFLTTDPNSLKFKIKNSYFIPNPADKSFETLENYKHDCENDLFFAMSHGVHRGILKKNKSDNRERILEELLIKNKEIKFDFYGYNNRQPIWAEDFKNQLSKSKMGLNLSRGKPLKYYSSDRIAQLMGNGLLTFIDEKTSYSDFFTKKEIITYTNTYDLIEKILKYKKDDKQRRIIARNGKNKYLKIFNSSNVANFIISKTFQLKNKSFW